MRKAFKFNTRALEVVKYFAIALVSLVVNVLTIASDVEADGFDSTRPVGTKGNRAYN